MKKLVVITGAGSGIGAAIAKKFSVAGYPLLLLGRRAEKMEALNLPNALYRKVDVLDMNAFASAIKDAEVKFGVPVDCLINNAGIMLLGHAETQAIEEWNTMIDINIKGVLNGMNLVLKDMVDRNNGTIINVSSIAGKKTFENHAIYCGTKFAVHSITETIRQEVSHANVRVTLIAPGVVETELMSHTTNSDIVDGYNEWKKSMGKGLYAENIAEAAFFIYSQPQEVCIREIVVAPTKQDT
ncbi:MAG: SDR family oxidoreductase [Brevinema sp.]